MKVTRPHDGQGSNGNGTIAEDQFVDVATADLDYAEKGVVRGAMRELDAMESQRKSADAQRRSADRSSTQSHAPSHNSANFPTIRNGVARILNAAAEAVEEYLDVEEDEDQVPEIPEGDHFAGMRSKVDQFIAEADRKAAEEQSAQSLSSCSRSLEGVTKKIPGIEFSSTEAFNEPVGRNKSLPDSPFLRSKLQARPIDNRANQIFNSGSVAFDKRDTTSFEVMGRDRIRDSLLASQNARPSPKLPPKPRPRFSTVDRHPLSQNSGLAGDNLTPTPFRDSRELRRSRALQDARDPSRISLASAPSQGVGIGLGTIEETRYDDAGRLVRRRIALPWQATFGFGCVTIIGCLAGLTTLGIAIRNVIYLNGPRAGPQLPDIKLQLDQILALLGDPQLR